MYVRSAVVLSSKFDDSDRGSCSDMNAIAMSVKYRTVVMTDELIFEYDDDDVAANYWVKSASRARP
jgi:hypothetical protein